MGEVRLRRGTRCRVRQPAFVLHHAPPLVLEAHADTRAPACCPPSTPAPACPTFPTPLPPSLPPSRLLPACPPRSAGSGSGLTQTYNNSPPRPSPPHIPNIPTLRCTLLLSVFCGCGSRS